MTESSSAPVLIQGSWEALLQEAQQFATQQNDEAIPIFTKVVQRLGRMSKQQRLANGGRLQQIFSVAAINAQSYLTFRQRYDDALETLADLHRAGDEHDQAFAEYQRIRVLLMADRMEEAFTELQTRTKTTSADIADWGQLVITYLRHSRLADAVNAVSAAESWLAEQQSTGALDNETLAEAEGYLATLQADVAMRQDDWDTVNEHFARALAMDPLYRQNLHLFYTSLLQAGKPDLAVPYILQDTSHPIRSQFWHGVALLRQGDEAAAKEQWEQVLQVDIKENEEPSFTEYVLTHYYMGDQERIGLGNMLRILQEDRRYEWQNLFLAGLGWAIQEQLDSTMTNLQFAVDQRRMAAEGKQLPYQTWTHVRDLLDTNTQQTVQHYFETEWL